MASSILVFYIIYLFSSPIFYQIPLINSNSFILEYSLLAWLFLLFFIWKRFFSNSSIQKFGNISLSFKSGLICIIYGVMMFFLTFTMLFILFYLVNPAKSSLLGDSTPQISLQTIIHTIIISCIITPIVEELFFRFGIYNSYRIKFNTGASVILSSLIFAVAHLRPEKIINVFLLGVCLALIYTKYKNIWASILLHMANNICATLIPIFGIPMFVFVLFNIISFGTAFYLIKCYLLPACQKYSKEKVHVLFLQLYSAINLPFIILIVSCIFLMYITH